MNYYVYILYNPRIRKCYKGFTENLRDRLLRHHRSQHGFTSRSHGWQLVWYTVFPSKMLALRFEAYLKSGSGIAFAKKHFFQGENSETKAARKGCL